MGQRIIVQVVTTTVVMVFAMGIWLTGGTPEWGWLRFYSAAVTAAVILLTIWDHWLWHLPLIQRIPKVPRDLRGTWKGTLQSFWINPETNLSPPVKSAYLVIRQSASSISIVLLTDESRSKSSLATISDDGTGTSLDYMYLNRPESRFEDRSRMHHGSTSLNVLGRPANRLRGSYWTNRDSKGDLDFNEKTSFLADDFAEVNSLFEHRRQS